MVGSTPLSGDAAFTILGSCQPPRGAGLSDQEVSAISGNKADADVQALYVYPGRRLGAEAGPHPCINNCSRCETKDRDTSQRP